MNPPWAEFGYRRRVGILLPANFMTASRVDYSANGLAPGACDPPLSSQVHRRHHRFQAGCWATTGGQDKSPTVRSMKT